MRLEFETTTKIDGKTYTSSHTVEADTSVTIDHGANNTVAAAKAGTLTTRSSDTGGVITLDAGHGFTTGTFDLHWLDPTTGDPKSRRGVTCTIVTNACTVSSGTAGSDVLPVATTAITVAPIESDTIVVVGDNAKAIAIWGQNQTSYAFYTSAPALITEGVIAEGESFVWSSGSGVDNPLAGVTTATVKLSQASTTAGRVRGSVAYT